MKTLESIKSDIQQRIVNLAEETKNKIEILSNNQKRFGHAVANLELKLPAIISALEKQGLGLNSFSFHRTGMGDNWEANSKLNVSISAQPINGKFKFITFNGYTVRGADRNEARLDAKAEKLQEAIRAETGIESVDVNSRSLSVESQDKAATKSVLITLWIAPTI